MGSGSLDGGESNGWGGGNGGFFVQMGSPSTLEDTMRAFPHSPNSSLEVEIELTWPEFMCNIAFSIHSLSVHFYFLVSPADHLSVFLSSFFVVCSC